MSAAPAPATRPRRASTFLDRETVVRAAADLADREGWAAVTLSQVAKEVDRHVTSMYGHVDNLAHLQREVALLAMDELTDEVWSAALGLVRADALQAIGDVYRRYALAHPGRITAMYTVRSGDEEFASRGLRLAQPIRATFRSYGLDDEQAAAAHRIFSATVNGLVRTGGDDDDLRRAVALFDRALSAGLWPEG